MSNSVEDSLQHNSTIFNEDWPSFFCKICRTVLSNEFDSSFRQHFQTVFDNIRQKILSNAGEKCLMPSIAGEKSCQKMMSTYRQHFQTTFLDKVLQNLTNFLSNYVEICFMLTKFTVKKSWRKLLTKNVVKKCCQILIRQHF